MVADGFLKRKHFTAREWDKVIACLNGWSVPNLVTAEEFQDYIEKNGFKQIKYRDISQYTFPSARRMYLTALINYPVQKISSWLRLRTDVQNANYFAGLYQYYLMRQGMSGYGIISAVK